MKKTNDYIERDKAIITINKLRIGLRAQGLFKLDMAVAEVKKRIDSLPAADVRPVVKAIWRYKTMTVPGGKGQTYAKWCCTACHGKVKEKTNFCPNCGADMRGEKDE